MQGQLGDCWFLGIAAAIGEWSDRTKLIFKNSDYSDKASKNGVFEVKMWMYGREVKVVVDDRIFVKSDDRLMFARRDPHGAWWVPILEKAAAKFYGTYENLHFGLAENAIYALTGMPSFKMDLSLYSVADTFERL